ncbi:MAG: hypothetical protein II877_10120 [Synergistaceae bacterium]|nr:hypothetical protein [Synergistaceae bacterium]
MRHKGLSLTKQKDLAFAALRNYKFALLEVHDYNAIRELRNLLKGFSDTLRSSKPHRKLRANHE